MVLHFSQLSELSLFWRKKRIVCVSVAIFRTVDMQSLQLHWSNVLCFFVCQPEIGSVYSLSAFRGNFNFSWSQLFSE